MDDQTHTAPPAMPHGFSLDLEKTTYIMACMDYLKLLLPPGLNTRLIPNNLMETYLREKAQGGRTGELETIAGAMLAAIMQKDTQLYALHSGCENLATEEAIRFGMPAILEMAVNKADAAMLNGDHGDRAPIKGIDWTAISTHRMFGISPTETGPG